MKGFTHVLEGILAAFLLIGAVTTIVPQIETGSNPRTEFRDRTFTRLQTMDRTGNLRENIQNDKLEGLMTETSPTGYETQVSMIETDHEEKRYELSSGSEEKDFNVSGEDFEVQLWLESASDVNVSFNDTRLLTDVSEDRYFLRPLEEGNGTMEVNGTGTITASVNGYQNQGSKALNSSVQSVKYVDAKNYSVQIGVFSWE